MKFINMDQIELFLFLFLKFNNLRVVLNLRGGWVVVVVFKHTMSTILI